MWWRSLDVQAPADDAWALLVDTRRWPEWGPTVAGARVDGVGTVISAGSTGAVRTPVGVWLPFAVEDWVETTDERRWSWRVAGVPATSHRVTPVGDARCRLAIGVPRWAPPYLPVVELGLRRLRRIAERAG